MAAVRIKGHGLHPEFGRRKVGETIDSRGIAICQCGMFSPTLPNQAARREWHRQHLLEILAARCQ
jgi:hypothetical protein